MKTNLILVPFVAVLTLLLVGCAAGELVNEVTTTLNGVELDNLTMAGMVGETVPVRVTFTALESVDDVKLKVTLEGLREDVDVSTDRFNLVNGSTYSKLLTLRLPSELKDSTKEFTLYVEVVSSTDKTEESYTMMMQRESYTLEVLSVDYDLRVEAGDSVPVTVVLQNTGSQKLDNCYVVVAVSGLDVAKRVWVGDLYSMDIDNDEKDTVQTTLNLRLPEDAEAGVYDMTVLVGNKDTSTSVNKPIRVNGESGSSDTLTIDGKDAGTAQVSTTAVALTVVLVIIFVVLLVVLVVLLTRKEKPIEELETSYY